MPRDNFSRAVVDRLARRAGMRCSCPECRAPTAGPDAGEGVANIGVGAHITAASPGGARYDATLSAEARSGASNGIWLCQNHAKLIDDDELRFTVSVLQEWKETAEHMAALEIRGYEVRRAAPFQKLDKQAPALLAEMRTDFQGSPLVRQIIVLPNRRVMYTHGNTPCFTYFLEDHPHLMSVLQIMENIGAIWEVTFNSVPRYNVSEEFVSYLVGE